MRTYDSYLFDLDGTVYLGQTLLPGAAETIRTLKEEGRAVRYVTNNPTRSPEEYAEKLSRLGVPTVPGEVVTSVTATVTWLTTRQPDACVYPIGEPPLHEALRSAGVHLSQDPAEIDVVLASFDRTFTYAKLQTAFDALWFHGGATLMATNPDRYCPYPGGRGEPDAAAIIAAIEACTGVTCSMTFGKPNPLLAQLALETIGPHADPTRSIMIGDRLETDIAMGGAARMDTALVLTGDSSRADLSAAPSPPTYVLDGLAGLLD